MIKVLALAALCFVHIHLDGPSRLIPATVSGYLEVGDQKPHDNARDDRRGESKPCYPICGASHVFLVGKVGILVFVGGAFTKLWQRLQSKIWKVRSGYPALMLCWAIGWSVGMFVIVVAGGLWAVI